MFDPPAMHCNSPYSLPGYAVTLRFIPVIASKSIEDKEIWVSPRFQARTKAESAAKLREGENQTRQHLAEVYAARKTGVRVK